VYHQNQTGSVRPALQREPRQNFRIFDLENNVLDFVIRVRQPDRIAHGYSGQILDPNHEPPALPGMPFHADGNLFATLPRERAGHVYNLPQGSIVLSHHHFARNSLKASSLLKFK
jgi:hypothetical protein